MSSGGVQRLRTERPHARNVILSFLVGGLLAGLSFGWLTGKPDSAGGMYTTVEYWFIPTWRYWIIASLIFLSGLMLSYWLSLRQGWLKGGASRSVSRLSVAALIIAVSFPLTALMMYGLRQMLGLTGMLLSPCVFALLLSLALWCVTRKFNKQAMALMVLVSILTIPLTNLAFALLKIPDDFFSAFEFSFGESLLAALCGYWISTADNNGFKDIIKTPR